MQKVNLAVRIAKKSFLEKKILNPHVLILGDNQKVLKDIKDTYEHQVSLIYIDPPYNRGDDFKFYKDTKNHDEWLEEMHTTILELREFLSAEGSIWISIDDFEMAYLKVCCDEIFGRENFVSTIIWQRRNTRENRKIFSNNHEYVLVYAKDINKFKKKRNLLPATQKLLDRYKNPDNDTRGPWQSVTLSVQAGHAVKSQFYTIVSPTGKKHKPPKGRCWIYNEERMQEEIKNNNIWFGSDGNGVPRLKKILDVSKLGVVPETLWNVEFAGSTKEAKQELLALEIYDEDVFDTPKPEQLIYRIMQIATNENDLVLDCFMGSGTTAAVAHKFGRNYIGIELNRKVYKYASERLKKVCNGESGGISSALEWNGGGEYLSCEWK
ncbi:site-specific DNA-methyltransferase [uncultured Phocaeicola sp.]|jgi:adenine-specific DNA-methyltransferase|uniref:site-specific DNA-methyltransferase n=1 Tax=uncultured Phocaeicola sp. TaxID=990718 RepID=UPI00260B3FFC|nr:site-specific DNA-methyltransferase [uncultured Phocaeicola sp.]